MPPAAGNIRSISPDYRHRHRHNYAGTSIVFSVARCWLDAGSRLGDYTPAKTGAGGFRKNSGDQIQF